MIALVVALLAALVPRARGLDNGLARVPPMGWLSWERYACETDCDRYPLNCVDEELYLRQARALVDGGYAKAGYVYLDLDDCVLRRGPDGRLQADPARFPHGMAWLGEQLHALGLRFGSYLDVGTESCAGYAAFNVTPPGAGAAAAAGYVQDVQQMAGWGVDSLKVDGCHASVAAMNVTYPLLGKALAAAGRPVLFACSWPDYRRIKGLPVQLDLVADTCNVFRVYDDIRDSFESVRGIAQYWAAHGAGLAAATGPGAFADADMLMVGGGGLSPAQEELQMALWCVWAVPLLVSADMTAVPAASRAVLLNEAALAVSQDPLGRPGVLAPAASTATVQVWWRPLQGGRVAVAVANLDDFGGPVAVTWAAADVGLPPGSRFNATNVFRGGAPVPSTAAGTLTSRVLSTSCAFYVLVPSS